MMSFLHQFGAHTMSNATHSRQSLYVDPALFTETVSFAGVFRSNGVSSPPVSVELSFSRTNDHPPYGVIRGTSEVYDRLELFFRRFRAPYRLEGISQAEGRERFTAEKVIIRSLNRNHYPTDEAPTIHQTIGNFDVLDFSIVRPIPRPSVPARRMVFLMAGPRGQWAAHSIRNVSYDGNLTTEHLDVTRPLTGAEDIKLSVKQHYLYRSRPSGLQSREMHEQLNSAYPHRSFMVEAEIVSLEVEDLAHGRADDDFRVRAIEIVDAASDVTSFISKASTQWYSYAFITEQTIGEHFRSTHHDHDPGYHYEDHVIGSGDAPGFIGVAVGVYLRRRSEGLDLKLPLRQYVAAHRARYINDQLATIYNALEQIVSMVPEDIKGGLLLSRSEFRIFKRATERTLNHLKYSTPVSGTIINKLRNTTDPGFRGKLAAILKHFEVYIDDIGGDDQLARACRTRNALIHSHSEPDIRDMVQGRNFLVTVFERLAVTLLGWDGRIMTPTLANQSLLVSRA